MLYNPRGSGWGFSSVPEPNPRGVGRGVQRGWGVSISRVYRAFLNSLFQSEHWEYTQVGGVRTPLAIHLKWGKMGGKGGNSVPRLTEAKKIFRVTKLVGRCSLLVWVGGVLRGVRGGGGGGVCAPRAHSVGGRNKV